MIGAVAPFRVLGLYRALSIRGRSHAVVFGFFARVVRWPALIVLVSGSSSSS